MAKTKIENFVINKVKEKRTLSAYTQNDLASFLNVSSGFIGKAESPKHSTKYNLNHLNKLALIFKCSPKDFLPDEGIE